MFDQGLIPVIHRHSSFEYAEKAGWLMRHPTFTAMKYPFRLTLRDKHWYRCRLRIIRAAAAGTADRAIARSPAADEFKGLIGKGFDVEIVDSMFLVIHTFSSFRSCIVEIYYQRMRSEKPDG